MQLSLVLQVGREDLLVPIWTVYLWRIAAGSGLALQDVMSVFLTSKSATVTQPEGKGRLMLCRGQGLMRMKGSSLLGPTAREIGPFPQVPWATCLWEVKLPALPHREGHHFAQELSCAELCITLPDMRENSWSSQSVGDCLKLCARLKQENKTFKCFQTRRLFEIPFPEDALLDS